MEELDYGEACVTAWFAGSGFRRKRAMAGPRHSLLLGTRRLSLRFQPLGRRRNQPRINYAQPDRRRSALFLVLLFLVFFFEIKKRE